MRYFEDYLQRTSENYDKGRTSNFIRNNEFGLYSNGKFFGIESSITMLNDLVDEIKKIDKRIEELQKKMDKDRPNFELAEESVKDLVEGTMYLYKETNWYKAQHKDGYEVQIDPYYVDM